MFLSFKNFVISFPKLIEIRFFGDESIKASIYGIEVRLTINQATLRITNFNNLGLHDCFDNKTASRGTWKHFSCLY